MSIGEVKEVKAIYVTQPFLPPLEELLPYLEDIWKRKWLTNNGYYHQELERSLCESLDVPYVSLFANGTLALITALQVLRISGEVITTPFSFVATTHALWWNGIKPVFVDIEPAHFNLDPDRIESAITPKTAAILPVHVFGNPCDVNRIQEIADTYGLPVIYDACHAFGVKIDEDSVLNFGDLSVLSFHATKVFTTFEGGAIVCHDQKTKKRIDYLKNFGFAGETTVVAPGINAKMNEFQAALGILQLTYFQKAVEKRGDISERYRAQLSDVRGISFLHASPEVQYNYSYFPIIVDRELFGVDRDEIYRRLRQSGIYSRRYFYPLISNFPSYRSLPSSEPANLPVANKVADRILCLPLYPDLKPDEQDEVITTILRCQGREHYKGVGMTSRL